MAAPILTWWNIDNTKQENRWDIGTVDAGTPSQDKTFLIWNNRGGQTDVSDCTSCTITTKDDQGNDMGELVTNLWIKVRVDSMGESNFTAIGGPTVKTIKAGGTAPAGTIKGTANDGSISALENYAQITCHALPHALATAGNVNFLLRVSYSYV